MCDRADDFGGELSLRAPRRIVSADSPYADYGAFPSKDADDTADVKEEINIDAIVDEMSIEDLRDLAKRILRIGKNNNDDRMLSEINFLIHRQQHRRWKQSTTGFDEKATVSDSLDAVGTAVLDPSHPDSILSLPPLLRNSRSPDSDVPDTPKRFLRRQVDISREPISPTERTSNMKPARSSKEAKIVAAKATVPTPKIQNKKSSGSDRIVDKNRGKSNIRGFGKRQLVVLCNRKPATVKESKDQDLAMTLCKNMGIIPCVVVSSLSSENPIATEDERLLVDSMGVNTVGQNGDDRIPGYTYPQFFVRDVLWDRSTDGRDGKIHYKGNYDIMEALYQTGRFSADSLEGDSASSTIRGMAVKTTATPLNNDTKKETQLGSFLHDTSKPQATRAGEPRGSASVGEPSLPSPRETISEKPLPKPSQQLSPQPLPERQSSFSSGSRSHSPVHSEQGNNSVTNASASFHFHMSNSDSLQLTSLNDDPSYSHLDGLNQPKSNQSSTGSGYIGEGSLGDDLRMIFEIESDVLPSSIMEHTKDLQAQHPGILAAVPTISENKSEEEADDDDGVKTYPKRTSTSLVAIPTIREDDEEEEEETNMAAAPASLCIADEEEELEQEEQDESEDNTKSTVSMTVLPSGTIVKRETVTLKSRKERPPAEPPGFVATNNNSSGYLDQARMSLKAPPSSPAKHANAAEPKAKSFQNPYYALAEYSGGKSINEPQESEVKLPLTEPSQVENLDPTPTVTEPSRDEGESAEMPLGEVGRIPEEHLPWGKKYMGTGACYLVFHSANDELNIHYSESPMPNTVGVWTSPDIGNFKATQDLSECELIGTCASEVTQDPKNFCQGWCQFVKAAKIMDATITALDGVGLPVEFYLYDKGRTIMVSSCDGEAVFDTKAADAVACVPKGCDFSATGLVGKKWAKTAKKLGAVALFRSLSVKKSKDVDDESLLSRNTNNTNPINEISVDNSTTFDESYSTLNHGETKNEEIRMVSSLDSTEVSLSAPAEHAPKPGPKSEPLRESGIPIEAEAMATLLNSSELPCPDEGACYLLYDPDSSGQLLEQYSKSPIDFALGRWVPGSEKKIAGFKFKRNLGRNVLIGHCSGGIQGRKNFYSGWCQFVRSAKNMKGEVVLWNPTVGHKGLKVDVFLYYDDYRPYHQTVRMKEGTAYNTDKVLAVACLPKETDFFDSMTVDLILWLAEGSKHGYSTKM